MRQQWWRVPLSDVLLALAFVAFVVIEGLVTGTEVGIGPREVAPNAPLYLAISVPAMAAFAVRRRFPTLVAFVVILANILVNVEGKSSTTLAMAIAAYSVGVHSERVYAVAVLPASILTGGLIAGVDRPVKPSDLAAFLLWVLGPWAIGRFIRSRDRAAGAAIERAELLERERSALAAAAAAEERVRLARELHDVVSHSISVVAVQTQAVRRRLRAGQEREIDDLKAVEATAREAMAELRRLFGVLRGQEGMSLAPQPGLAELDRLAEQVRTVGLDVRIRHDGDRTPLNPGVDLAAYRIIQEAITNAIKHSGASAVEVTVSQSPGAVAVRIDDDGSGLIRSAGGHGLVGIRERAELYGGSLAIEESPLGGVRVSARLPLDAP